MTFNIPSIDDYEKLVDFCEGKNYKLYSPFFDDVECLHLNQNEKLFLAHQIEFENSEDALAFKLKFNFKLW